MVMMKLMYSELATNSKLGQNDCTYDMKGIESKEHEYDVLSCPIYYGQ